MLNPLMTYHKAFQNDKTRLLVIIGTILYFISPIDILPDIIPLIGQIDDGLLFVMFLVEIVSWHRNNNKTMRDKGDKGEVLYAKFEKK